MSGDGKMSEEHKHRIRKHKKKSFKRRALAKLGIRHVTRRMVIFYICVFFLLVVLVRPIMDLVSAYITYFVKSSYAPEKLSGKGKVGNLQE